MNYKIVNGSVSYGAETILEEINFEIKEKEKIAIVGRNGSGKSTLLKAIIHNELLEEGIGSSKFGVYQQGSPVIGYLKQIEFEDANTTLLDEILKIYQILTDLEKKMIYLENQLKEDSNEKMIREYTDTLEKYKRLDGYTYQKEYETVLNKFGFDKEDKYKKISEFSGGQKTKIAFVKLLLSKPDILLLDEPTNNLDITTIEWLENYLKNYPKSVVIVSHDRMFLDKIVSKIYEIEYATLTEYTGNYASFEVQKRMNYEKQLKDYEYQQKEIKRLQTIADRFRYKPTKAKMALSKLKKIEQMVKVEEPNQYDLRTFHTNFSIEVNSGNKVLTVRDLEIGYDKVLSKVSFELYKGQKLGIIGANGMGKTTLLRTLMGMIPKLSGTFEYGYHVKKEYFDQQLHFEDKNRTVLEEFSKEFPNLTITETRNALGAFMFSGEDVLKKIAVLSGGERSRLQLCKIFKKKPNLLILDEPTNHMDIIGKESLEYLLKNYEGSLLFVSHDRYFVNKIADSLLVFENGKVKYFNLTYNEYLAMKENSEEIEEENKNEKIQNSKTLENKEKYKIRKRIGKLETEISKREEKIKLLEFEMQKEEVCTDYVKLGELQKEIQNLNDELDILLNEWEELSSNI
ncbi:MAG: ABC-F type ribosomal protection protein [Clostridia bacterium]|nr:ABC-F type ribosomal protection protein [Clostridia bacterium]